MCFVGTQYQHIGLALEDLSGAGERVAGKEALDKNRRGGSDGEEEDEDAGISISSYGHGFGKVVSGLGRV